MIAIFSALANASMMAGEIHEILKGARQGYRAERWAVPVEHPVGGQWAVPLPPEWETLGMDLSDCELVESITPDWTPDITEGDA